MDYYIDNMPNTAMGVLNLFSTSQAGVDRFTDQIIRSVQQGETNPLKVRIWVKTMELICSRLKSETSEDQLIEADKYGEKTFEYAGAKITKTEVSTKYDFSKCGDPIWESREQILSAAKAQLKEREDFLKTIKEPITMVDDLSGEIVTITPPIKTSVSGLNVSIK